jgi:hypothetical protein
MSRNSNFQQKGHCLNKSGDKLNCGDVGVT